MTRLLAAGLLLVAGLIAAGLVAGADIAADEGSYLEAARAVASGRVLYHDVAYSQGPVVPVVTAGFLKILGFGLVGQRALNAIWGLLALALLLHLAGAEGGDPAVRMTGVALAFSPSWLDHFAVGNTYGLTSLLLALTAAAALRLRGDVVVLALTAGLASLAIGCRLSVAPFAAVLVGTLALRPFTPRGTAAGALAGLGVLGIVFGPFLVLDASNVAFWTVGFHAATSLKRPRIDFLREAWALSPAFPFLLALGLAAWLRLRREGRAAGVAGGLLAASVVVIACHAVLPAPYGGYLTPFVGPGTLASALLFSRGFSGRARRVAEIGVAAVAAIGALVVRPDFAPEAVGDLRTVARLLRAATPPGAGVATSMPETAVEADRPCLPGLENGKFGFTDSLPPAEAERRRLMPAERLIGILARGEAGAVVFSRRLNWNFYWSAPSLAPVRPETRDALRRAIDARYDHDYQGPAYIVLLPRAAPQEPGRVRPGDKMSR